MSARQDKAQFECLVRPELASLYRTALRMVRQRAVAEDIVQETCLKAFASFDQGREKDNFRAWLFRILCNLCIDYIRAAGREAVMRNEVAKIQIPPGMDRLSPEQLAISRSQRDQLNAAIESLAPELRLVVLLVLVEELSYAETAESLDIPVGTVRSRLNRARTQLQPLLNDQMPERRRLLGQVTDAGIALP